MDSKKWKKFFGKLERRSRGNVWDDGVESFEIIGLIIIILVKRDSKKRFRRREIGYI